MSTPDLNLLITLDVLLAEGSVARAARRLRLSPSAMSRALARLRETTGDPLLVRAGRGLVPTPRALALRDQVAGPGKAQRSGEARDGDRDLPCQVQGLQGLIEGTVVQAPQGNADVLARCITDGTHLGLA